MKTATQLVGFIMMLSFLAFIWLSHSGVLPGSSYGHFFGGCGMFILAILGLVILGCLVDSDLNDKTCELLIFIYSILLVLNSIFYIVLKSANLIGPYPTYDSEGSDVLLGIFYIILSALGIYFISIMIRLRSRN